MLLFCVTYHLVSTGSVLVITYLKIHWPVGDFNEMLDEMQYGKKMDQEITTVWY